MSPNRGINNDNTTNQQLNLTPHLPMNRMKFRTIGKIVLPTFLKNDSNNNTNGVHNQNDTGVIKKDVGEVDTKTKTTTTTNTMTTSLKIGKVKSPFLIETMKQVTTTNGTTKGSFDYDGLNFESGSQSGKENESEPEEEKKKIMNMKVKPSPVEIKKNLTNGSCNGSVTSMNKSLLIVHTTSTPNVDDKFAKYFGVVEIDDCCDGDETDSDTETNTTDDASNIGDQEDDDVSMFEDLNLTSDDLANASQEFDRLFSEDLGKFFLNQN